MSRDDCLAFVPLRAEPHLPVDPEHELGNALTRAWVACSEQEPGTPLGYALGWWVVDELSVLAVGVLPEARRRGVGRALIEHVVAWTAAAGGRRVTLEVAAGNATARRLYERAGFCVFNVRRGYYRATGEDALELECVIDAGHG